MKNLKQQLEQKIKEAQKSEKEYWKDWIEFQDNHARVLALRKMERIITYKEILELL